MVFSPTRNSGAWTTPAATEPGRCTLRGMISDAAGAFGTRTGTLLGRLTGARLCALAFGPPLPLGLGLATPRANWPWNGFGCAGAFGITTGTQDVGIASKNARFELRGGTTVA